MTASSVEYVQGCVPSGWQVETFVDGCALLREPSGLMFTVDFDRRAYALGCTNVRERERLIADAVRALRAVADS